MSHHTIPRHKMACPLTWVYQLLNLDAVSEHRRRVVLCRRKHDTGTVKQLDVLVEVHLLHTLGHARGVADLRWRSHKSDDAKISIAPWAEAACFLKSPIPPKTIPCP